jgi:hypothetical protein
VEDENHDSTCIMYTKERDFLLYHHTHTHTRHGGGCRFEIGLYFMPLRQSSSSSFSPRPSSAPLFSLSLFLSILCTAHGYVGMCRMKREKRMNKKHEMGKFSCLKVPFSEILNGKCEHFITLHPSSRSAKCGFDFKGKNSFA